MSSAALVWAALALGLLIAPPSSASEASADRLIGWRGDSFDHQQVFGASAGSLGSPNGPVQISEKPLAFIWEQFLTAAEAQHIVRLAMPRMMRSLVGGGADEDTDDASDTNSSSSSSSGHSAVNNSTTGHRARRRRGGSNGDGVDSVRTSYGMFIDRYQDEVVAGVQERLARWLGVPVVNQEDLQVLRYAPGQEYKPHTDANGRMCTVLIYLADTEQGGETAFPLTTAADWRDPSLAPPPETLSKCAQNHVAVKPKIGTALLFYSMPPGADKDRSLRRHVDEYSLHTGCPPLRGLKWTGTVWVHPEPFRPGSFSTNMHPPLPDPATCGDFNKLCAQWAASGECEGNRAYMVGGAGSPGHCRLSCKACTPCAPGDDACVAASRLAQGFLPNLEQEFKLLYPDADLGSAKR